MTIIAGALARHADVPLQDSLCSELSSSISRNPQHRVHVARFEFAFLCKVDIRAYGEPAFENTDTAAMLAGDPVLIGPQGSRLGTRQSDLMRLKADCNQSSDTSLRSVTGVFCFANYDP